MCYAGSELDLKAQQANIQLNKIHVFQLTIYLVHKLSAFVLVLQLAGLQNLHLGDDEAVDQDEQNHGGQPGQHGDSLRSTQNELAHLLVIFSYRNIFLWLKLQCHFSTTLVCCSIRLVMDF